MWSLLLLLCACGDKDADSGAPPVEPPPTLAQALGDRIPSGWSAVCVTWIWEWDEDSEFIAFDPSTGDRVTLFGRKMADEDWDVHGLSWDGTGLLLSGDELSAGRVDLDSGAIDRPMTDLHNLVAWGDRVLAEHTDQSWVAYASYEDAVAHTGGEAVPEVFDERLVVDGDYAYTAQPMTDALKLWHLPTGTFGDLPLQDFEGYVFGMALLGDRLLLLNDGRFRPNAEAWTGAILELKQLAVSGASAGAVVAELQAQLERIRGEAP